MADVLVDSRLAATVVAHELQLIVRFLQTGGAENRRTVDHLGVGPDAGETLHFRISQVIGLEGETAGRRITGVGEHRGDLLRFADGAYHLIVAFGGGNHEDGGTASGCQIYISAEHAPGKIENIDRSGYQKCVGFCLFHGAGCLFDPQVEFGAHIFIE